MMSFSEMLKSKGGFRRAIYDAVAEVSSQKGGLDIHEVTKELTVTEGLTGGYIDNPRGVKPRFVVYDFPLGLRQAEADFIFYITEVDNQKIYYKYSYKGETTPTITINFHIVY